MKNLITLFKALGDETRLKILIILSKRDICAKGLGRHLGISPAAISQHIKLLKEAGLIVGEKEGYFVRYHLQADCFETIKSFIKVMECPDSFDTSSLNEFINLDCLHSCQKQHKKCCHQEGERSI